MESNNVFFEIRQLDLSDGFTANMVMVENGGKGPAYLGWCENLGLDSSAEAAVVPDDGAAIEAPSESSNATALILPFADLGILSRQGSPIPAPQDWREMVVRSLVILDYLPMIIETELELNATAAS